MLARYTGEGEFAMFSKWLTTTAIVTVLVGTTMPLISSAAERLRRKRQLGLADFVNRLRVG
jgi:hypothetical protein